METTEPGMWSTARAVRVAVTTTVGVYNSTASSLAELSGTSAGSAAAANAGAAAMRPTARVPAAVNMKRSLDDVTLVFSPALLIESRTQSLWCEKTPAEHGAFSPASAPEIQCARTPARISRSKKIILFFYSHQNNLSSDDFRC